MNMCKKIVSLIICILLLSSMVVSANESINLVLDFSQFDDMAKEEFGGKYTSMKVADIPWTKSGIEELYGADIDEWTGDKISSWDGENDTAYFYINKNIGRSGAGMRMQSIAGTNTELYFIQEPLAEGKTAIFSYDFKVIRRNSSVNDYFRVSGEWRNVSYVNTKADPDYFTNQSDTSKKAPFSENKWYTSVVIVDGYNATSYLFDEDGTQLISATKTYASTATKTGAQIARLDGYILGGTEMYLDNIEKHVYYPSQTAPVLQKSNVVNGETEVARNSDFEFIFDQDVTGNVVITDKDGKEVVGVTTTKTAYNKLKVTLADNILLERKQNYTISFAGVKNSKNLTCGSENIAFETEDLHIWDNITVGAVSQNEDKVDVTFTLNDTLGYKLFSGVIMAIRYENGIMKAISSIPLTNEAAGSMITKTFELGTLTENSKIKFMQLDLTNGPVVLATGETE